MRHWSERYIGLPYEKYDCAQLCKKVELEVFDIEIDLPSNRDAGIRGISNQISSLKDDFAFKVMSPVEGDAVLMIGRGRLNHIGIACYIGCELYVLHAMRNAGMAVLHKSYELINVGLTIEGFYRWK